MIATQLQNARTCSVPSIAHVQKDIGIRGPEITIAVGEFARHATPDTAITEESVVSTVDNQFAGIILG